MDPEDGNSSTSPDLSAAMSENSMYRTIQQCSMMRFHRSDFASSASRCCWELLTTRPLSLSAEVLAVLRPELIVIEACVLKLRGWNAFHASDPI